MLVRFRQRAARSGNRPNACREIIVPWVGNYEIRGGRVLREAHTGQQLYRAVTIWLRSRASDRTIRPLHRLGCVAMLLAALQGGLLWARRGPERGCATLVVLPGPSACAEPSGAAPYRYPPCAIRLQSRESLSPFSSRTGGPPAHDQAAPAEADTWTCVPRSVPRSSAGHPVRRLVGSQLNFLAGAAVDPAKFHPVRGSRSATSDRARSRRRRRPSPC